MTKASTLRFASFAALAIAFFQAGERPARAMPHVEASPELGARIYSQYCARCHGVNMVNPGGSSFDLRKFPHDEKQRFLTSVVNGRNSMPAWGATFSTQELEALWAYITARRGS